MKEHYRRDSNNGPLQWRLAMAGFILLATVVLAACQKLEDPSLQATVDTSEVPPARVTSFNPQRNLYFGDLHIHTELSSDAFVLGGRSLPDDVYSFAKGGVIQHGAGYPIKLQRPLDFAAVTDHAEYMGQARMANLDIPSTQVDVGEVLREGNLFSITKLVFGSSLVQMTKGPDFRREGIIDKAVNKDAWQMVIDAADNAYEPGVFTSFIGYEWSSFHEGSFFKHLHRNVIYRSNDVSELPFSALDSNRPEDLWAFLETENAAGRSAFAIPHNPNISGGFMYDSVDSDGKPLTAEYASLRARHEPLSEILQIKGSSETHPLLSSLDEFADYGVLYPDRSIEEVKGSYSRDALRLGLELFHAEGFNPYRFGVIGSSDSHNASSPAEEDNYHGKMVLMDGSAGLRTHKALLLPKTLNPGLRWTSGGLAAVWAQENTRESIYDAMVSKETFATSGTRISVRFFGGWNYEEAMLEAADLVEQAYAGGVPMGGLLASGPANRSPRFITMAMKDPDGANLDRVQIIKAWVDADGQSHERVYDVTASGGRVIDPATGKLPAVGNTVDVANATYTNSIGTTSLAAVWVDPDFDATQQAVYYARVLEIPTPRWSTFDARTLGVEPMQPTTIQERAITSAIWYRP